MKTFVLNCLFAAVLGGCASADIIIRDDQSPSPLDTNYLTMIYETDCDGEKRISFGQAACSLPLDADLTQHSISVYTPLGGSFRVRAPTAGVDFSIFLDKWEKVTFTIDELLPPQASEATFQMRTYWEKPESVETEIPVRGQIGQFYFRLRPQGSSHADLAWNPSGGGTQGPMKGALYAQFRASSTDYLSREPIMLTITTTNSVPDGRYELWNAKEGIGIQNTPFAGDEILIPRTAILGAQKKGDYTLYGWAVTEHTESEPVQLLELNDDFIVGVSIFENRTKKLTAKLNFTDSEVCYKTESSVSLVAYSGSEEISNDVEGCFPRPDGEAMMAFYTNVGRAALAVIHGPSGTYEVMQ